MPEVAFDLRLSKVLKARLEGCEPARFLVPFEYLSVLSIVHY
jgi:hypothetical protein